MGIYEQEIKRICREPLPWEQLEGRTILISGATGGIGKCLTDLFMYRKMEMGQKFRIVALSRRKAVARERFADYWKEEGFQYPGMRGDRIYHPCSQQYASSSICAGSCRNDYGKCAGYQRTSGIWGIPWHQTFLLSVVSGDLWGKSRRCEKL